MRLCKLQFRLVYITLFLSLVLFIAGFQRRLPANQNAKPRLTGTNERFVTSGQADDGDDKNTGPRELYIDPKRSAADGKTIAVSDPQNFRTLRGVVAAEAGPKPARASRAVATNKATSTFSVEAATTCRFRISSTASASLRNGSGSYRVVARVLDQRGKYVNGTDFQTRYAFKKNANGKIDAAQDGNNIAQIENGKFISPSDTGPRMAFTLQPGTYTLLFELNIDVTATGSAAVKVVAMVDLI